LGCQDHIDIEVFEIGCWTPLAAAHLPKAVPLIEGLHRKVEGSARRLLWRRLRAGQR
jgi:hypothetical protein